MPTSSTTLFCLYKALFNEPINNFFRTIQTLLESNLLLNQTLAERGIIPSSPTSFQSSYQNQYCLNNPCYTPTEFGLYGVCIGIAGIFIAVFVVSRLTSATL